jgi:CRISPR-associated protein Cmr3
MSKYLLTMRPVDLFFFGQENKYRKRNGKTEADYFQVSDMFPQQTTIIGSLRYLILDINNQIPILNKNKAVELIGPKGFRITQQENDYGKINNIGPVFIKKGNEYLMPNPLDINHDSKQLQISKNENIKTNFANPYIHVTNYIEKKGLAHELQNIKSNDFYDYSNDENDDKAIFIKVEKIGINKKQSEDAFFKQVYYKFNPKIEDAAFVCNVEIEDGVIDENKKYLVPMGAEKQIFEFEFAKDNTDILNEVSYSNSNKQVSCLLLLSNTYVTTNQNQPVFGITNVKPFRFLQTETKKGSGEYSKFSRSKNRFNLYERGSILFFNDDNHRKEFIKEIDKHKDFKQIGYNQYLTIN